MNRQKEPDGQGRNDDAESRHARKRFIPTSRKQKTKVVVVGGGIAGLTVAHELVHQTDLDLNIVVLEKHNQAGGKARTSWDCDKFSEHSMRVLPGSYVCMHQIMSEIPLNENQTALDRLTPVKIKLKHGAREFTILGNYTTRVFGTLKYFWDVCGLIWFLLRTAVRIDDLVVFLSKIARLLFLPSRSVTEQLSRLKFSEYVGGDDGKPNRFAMIYRLAEILVAAKSHSSAGVVSHTLLEWFVTPFLAGTHARNAVSEFDGATSDVLIEPWVKFLKNQDVEFEQALVGRIDAIGGRVLEVQLTDKTAIQADVVILAVQHNIAHALIGENLRKHLPELVNFPRLGEEWAHSVQFQVPELKGDLKELGAVAVAALDSPWSIAYRVYSKSTWNDDWPGDSNSAVFTATISNTKRPGKIYHLPFLRCTPDQILHEVVAQTGLSDALEISHGDLGLDLQVMSPSEAAPLEDRGYATAAIGPDDNRVYVTDAQMYIRLPGNLDIEPENTTGAYNFFLAGEYTRTKYRIPTMEKSCESGKRCARAVIAALGGKNPREVPVCSMPLKWLRSEYFHMIVPRAFWLSMIAAVVWLVYQHLFSV